MGTDIPQIAVVIPFYQEDATLLDRALRTIGNQTGLGRDFVVRVVVVDDSSPCPASEATELASLPPPHTVTVIEQPNRGCVGARNAGLDSLSPDTDMVAFLDSDDEWPADHLANMVVGLAQGPSFYFADHQRAAWPTSKFVMRELSFVQMTRLDETRPIYAYDRDIWADCFDLILIQASTVGYDFAVYPDLRFVEALGVHSDEAFYCELHRLGTGVAICDQVESIMGVGVNVSVTEEYGTDKGLRLSMDFVNFWNLLPATIPIAPQHQALVARKRKVVRRELASALWHRLRMRKSGAKDAAVLWRATRIDPLLIADLLGVGLSGFRGLARRLVS